LSLLNHSCDPNILWVSHGSKQVVYAIKPIKKGDELLCNYGVHYALMPKSERQYHFNCRCQPCTSNWPMFQDLIDRPEKFKLKADLKEYENMLEEFQNHLKWF
jgi:SET and MYND domain-containing protein